MNDHPTYAYKRRLIPFTRELGLFADEDAPERPKIKTPDLSLPPLRQCKGGRYFRPNSDVHRFLQVELDVSRLNKIQRHLWLAGLPRGARPLHKQLLLDRQILITEQADLHLVWSKSRLFIKPLPLFLLVHEYWLDYICLDEALYQSACGFLLSYGWLIGHRSDLAVAHRLGLVPTEIGWQDWTIFMEDFLQHIDTKDSDCVNPRYRYGELRLNRLNWVFRFGFFHKDFRDVRRGYFQGPDWYSQYLVNNFGWLIAAFAYMTIVLSAMQVGLATNALTENTRFQDASYGFTVFSITMPVIIVGAILVSSGLIVLFSVSSTRQYNTRVERDPGPYIGIVKTD